MNNLQKMDEMRQRAYTFQVRGLSIKLTNEINNVMNISPKEMIKPFGGNIPEESTIYFSSNWKECFRNRFDKQFLDGLTEQYNLIEALISLTFTIAQFIQNKMKWTPAKAGTMAIEYILSTFALEHPTDIIEIEEYCRIVDNLLKPAYKNLKRACLLTAPPAFAEDWDTPFLFDDKKTSKSEINEAAKEAYFIIEHLIHNTHIGTFRNIINNTFLIFDNEKTWQALRDVADPIVRNNVIALLKKYISQISNPIVSLTDVKIAIDQALTNQTLTCGIQNNVTMDVFFQYLKSVRSEKIIKETNRSINLGPMSMEIFLQNFLPGLHNIYGYVGNARIEKTNGVIVVTFTLRDINEEKASEIGITVNLQRRGKGVSHFQGGTTTTA